MAKGGRSGACAASARYARRENHEAALPTKPAPPWLVRLGLRLGLGLGLGLGMGIGLVLGLGLELGLGLGLGLEP